MAAPDVCTSYSLVLAAEDVLPIIFGGVGYWYLAKRVELTVPEAAWPARIAGLLLVVGSIVAGPLRKYLVVTDDGLTCLPLLQNPFFSLLPACFAILAWALASVWRGQKARIWPFAGFAALAVIAALARENRTLLLAFGGVLAVATAVYGALVARKQGDRWTIALFTINALGTLALPAIGSSTAVSDVTSQWLAQGVNTVSQAAFGLACYRLFSVYAANRDRDPSGVVT